MDAPGTDGSVASLVCAGVLFDRVGILCDLLVPQGLGGAAQEYRLDTVNASTVGHARNLDLLFRFAEED